MESKTESQPTVQSEHAKKPLTPIQTALWTIGILAAFSALFLVFSLMAPGKS